MEQNTSLASRIRKELLQELVSGIYQEAVLLPPEVEIAARRMMKYPPYTDLCLFGFVGVEEEAVRQGTLRFLQMLRCAATGSYADVPMIVLDPSPAAVARVAGKYRYKMLVKTVNNARMRQMTAELVTAFGRGPENRAVSLFVDINPAVIP